VSAAPTDSPAPFAQRLVASMQASTVDVRGPGVVAGCYLHGSAALGGWNALRSDVDVLVVVSDWSQTVAAAVTHDLMVASSSCPGTGLECSVVGLAAAQHPAPPWPFLLHVASDRGPVRVVDGRSMAGDEDLLMHYAVTRAHGLTVHGTPARDMFGPIPRAAVLRYLANELDWGLEHADESYVVLNALRALVYVRDGALVSKVEAGQLALRDDELPDDLVRRALATQRGEADSHAPDAHAIGLVRRTQESLRTALSESA
jgi:hypothetical protein